MNRSEREIRTIFNGFAKELYDRKWNMLQEIDNWRQVQIHRIEEHANKEKSLLEQEFQKQGKFIEDSHQNFLNLVRPHERTGNQRQINELLAQCRDLKCELGATEFSEPSILFIRYMTEEQIAQKKRNEAKPDRARDSKPRRNVDEDNENYSTNSENVHKGSLSRPMRGHMEHTKQPSNTVASSDSYDNRYPNTSSGDVSMDECPVCSMSFPSHMTRPEQSIHVNAHFEES